MRLESAIGSQWFRYPAVVDSHLPEGYTKLRITISGGHYFDVPTEVIPTHLRGIGSKVTLCIDRLNKAEAPDEVRAMRNRAIRVEEFVPEENIEE